MAQKKNSKAGEPRGEAEILAAIKEKKILRGKISIISREKDTSEPFAIVVLNGVKYKISNSEIDDELEVHSLVNFVGRNIQFIPTKIQKDGVVLASRAAAQKVTKPKVMKKIEAGSELVAQIVNILPHGAYLEVDGVTGLLKNVDYASDCSAIKDLLHIGDTVKVKFKKYSSNGTILFEAVKKYVSPSAITIDDIMPDSLVPGVVRAVQPFGVFVQVVVGIDALCINKNISELEEDDRVTVRITQVDKETKRIRGEILPVK